MYSMIIRGPSMPSNSVLTGDSLRQGVEMAGSTFTTHECVPFVLTRKRLSDGSQSHHRGFSWYAGSEKPGVFEIDWQEYHGINRIALALECREVAVIDVTKIGAMKVLRETEGR